jgi:hypothetical protein
MQEVSARAAQVVPVATRLIKTGAEVTLESSGGALVLGPTPLADREVPRGDHRVVLRLRDYEDAVDAVSIRPDARVKVEKTLVPEAGTLDLEGNVDGMSVRLEALDRPAFPARSLPLPLRHAVPTGRYRLTVERANHFPRSLETAVRRGETIRLRQTLNAMALWSISLGAGADGLALADVDRDGTLDAIVAAYDGRVLAVSGRTTAVIWTAPAGEMAYSVPVIADLDRDGVPDVAAIGAGGLMVLSGRDGTRLWTHVRESDGPNPPAITDVDGDGAPDCVVPWLNGDLQALRGRDGRLLWTQKTEPRAQTQWVRAADTDGDGRDDLLIAAGGVSVRGFDARTGAPRWTWKSGASTVSGGPAGDLDGDGVPDAIAGAADGRLVAISGDGRILWTAACDDSLGPCEIADIDGDGRGDVLFTAGEALHARSGKEATDGRCTPTATRAPRRRRRPPRRWRSTRRRRASGSSRGRRTRPPPARRRRGSPAGRGPRPGSWRATTTSRSPTFTGRRCPGRTPFGWRVCAGFCRRRPRPTSRARRSSRASRPGRRRWPCWRRRGRRGASTRRRCSPRRTVWRPRGRRRGRGRSWTPL